MTFTPLEASSGADKSSSGENRFPTGGLLSGFKHLPVMPEEVIKFLECESGGIYIDGTLGSGGHAAEILKASSVGQIDRGKRHVGVENRPVVTTSIQLPQRVAIIR